MLHIWHACQTAFEPLVTQIFGGQSGGFTDSMAGTYLVPSWLLTSFSSPASGIYRLAFGSSFLFVSDSPCVTCGQIVIASESANNSYTITEHAARCSEASVRTLLFQKDRWCMCLLACDAGIGFDLISSNPSDTTPERKVQASPLASHNAHPHGRKSCKRLTSVQTTRRVSHGIARQGFPQQLACTAVCSCSAAPCACHSPLTTAVDICDGGLAAAGSLAKPLTTLGVALGASLLLLTAQPSTAEALQVQVQNAALLVFRVMKPSRSYDVLDAG